MSKQTLNELTGRTDEELKGYRESAIETLERMGYRKIDEDMIETTILHIIEALDMYKKEIQAEIERSATEKMEQNMSDLILTLSIRIGNLKRQQNDK